MTQSTKKNVMGRTLRLGTLLFATVAAALWLFVMTIQVVTGLQKNQDVFGQEGSLLALLVLVNVTGTAVGWWRTAAGSKILLLGGIALSLFSYAAAGRNRALAAAVSGLPFLLSGALLWVAARANSQQGPPA